MGARAQLHSAAIFLGAANVKGGGGDEVCLLSCCCDGEYDLVTDGGRGGR